MREIVDAFAQLNPYDPETVPGSILKIEDDNYEDPETRKRQRQLWCYAISAKRYVLFLRDSHGVPELLRDKINNTEDRRSEHGLGYLLNPADPEGDDREWIAQAWLRIVRKALGLRTRPVQFGTLPAVGRTSVSSPWVMRAFKTLNAGKPYREQIKPFNFLLSAHVRAFGHPNGVDPERFQLIAPYELNPRKWLTLPWIDFYSNNAKRYRVTTSEQHGPQIAELATYGDALRAYEFHEEFKGAGPDGEACTKQTTGLLGRRHVRIGAIHFIGKESNLLEEVEQGQVHDLQDVFTEYSDARREREMWRRTPEVLRGVTIASIARCTGLDRRTIQRIRNQGVLPHPRHRAALIAFAKQRGASSGSGV